MCHRICATVYNESPLILHSAGGNTFYNISSAIFNTIVNVHLYSSIVINYEIILVYLEIFPDGLHYVFDQHKMFYSFKYEFFWRCFKLDSVIHYLLVIVNLDKQYLMYPHRVCSTPILSQKEMKV